MGTDQSSAMRRCRHAAFLVVTAITGAGVVHFVGCSTTPNAAQTPASYAGPKAFSDASSRLGDSGRATGWPGLAAFDYDNDGDIDLLITGGAGTPPRLFQNDGQGNFVDVAEQAGLAFTGDICTTCAVGDFNNDGWLDVLLGRQRFNLPSNTVVDPIMFLSNGPGSDGVVTFRRVTGQDTGLSSHAPAMSFGIADFDGDGLLDIVVGRYDMSVFLNVNFAPIYETQPCEFWHCTGVVGGVPQYEQIANAGIEGTAQHGASAATASQTFIPGTFVVYPTDVDGDGRMDILELHDIPGGIDYFHNDGGLKFSVRQQDTLNKHGGWMGIAAGDFDGDGDLDYFVANTGCDFRTDFPAESIASLQNEPDGTYFHKLLRNDGGVLTDVAATTPVSPSVVLPPTDNIGGSGLQAFEFGFGATWIDTDNRGLLDLYWAGDGILYLQPGLSIDAHGVGRFLENGGDNSFSDQTAGRVLFDVQADRTLKFGQQDAGRSVIACDLNGDGFLDLVVTNSEINGGPNPIHRIFLNPGVAGNHWLTVRLQSAHGNRFGIGARVTIAADGKSQIQEIVTTTSAFAGVQPEAHFGLGQASVIDQLSVRWPSGAVTTLPNVAVDQVLTVTEP